MTGSRRHAYLTYKHRGNKSTLLISGPESVLQDEALHLDLADMRYGDFSNYLTFEPIVKFPMPSKKRVAKGDSVSVIWQWDCDHSFLLPFSINVSAAHPELTVTASRHLPHYAFEMSLKNGRGEKIETIVVDYRILSNTESYEKNGEVIRRTTQISPDLSELVKQEVLASDGHFVLIAEEPGSFDYSDKNSYSWMGEPLIHNSDSNQLY